MRSFKALLSLLIKRNPYFSSTPGGERAQFRHFVSPIRLEMAPPICRLERNLPDKFVFPCACGAIYACCGECATHPAMVSRAFVRACLAAELTEESTKNGKIKRRLFLLFSEGCTRLLSLFLPWQARAVGQSRWRVGLCASTCTRSLAATVELGLRFLPCCHALRS